MGFLSAHAALTFELVGISERPDFYTPVALEHPERDTCHAVRANRGMVVGLRIDQDVGDKLIGPEKDDSQKSPNIVLGSLPGELMLRKAQGPIYGSSSVRAEFSSGYEVAPGNDVSTRARLRAESSRVESSP